MSEEIITMLSNMGALEESKAVEKTLLARSETLKNKILDDEIRNLKETGYVKEVDGKLYLTQAGLFRALSRFS